MSYLERLDNTYRNSCSKRESLTILEQYIDELTREEYEVIVDSLNNHALEEIYLNERDIVLGIAQLRGEITVDEIVEIAKTI